MLTYDESVKHIDHLSVSSFADEHIAERIANNYELRLMSTLPEVDARFKYTTLITPEGVFQLNQEINQWTCLINAEKFHTSYEDLYFLLERAKEMTESEGNLIYHALTLKQLNNLDQALRLHQGDTIIGYSICEEFYLREVNFLAWLFCRELSQYEYPPLDNAYSKRLLTFIQRPLVIDITATLRVTAQSYLLFTYFTRTYFQYASQSQDDDVQFYKNNIPWLLLSVSVVIVLVMLLLRGSCVDKPKVLSVLIRLRYIEQSIISVSSNLTNYGPLIVSTAVIESSFLPLLIFAGVMGYYKNINKVVNIAHWTSFQFLLRSFFLSLTVGTFCSLGLYGLINDIFFLYANGMLAQQASQNQDVSFARYPTFALMLFVSLFRFPYASLKMQRLGWYTSNLINGISIALFDNFALFMLIGGFSETLYGNSFSPQEPVGPIFYCILTALSFMAVFLVTFPTTSNLPKYSLEKNPIKPTWITKTLQFFDTITECRLPEKNNNVPQTKSFASIGIEFSFERFACVSRALCERNLFSHSVSNNHLLSSNNPLHKNQERECALSFA